MLKDCLVEAGLGEDDITTLKAAPSVAEELANQLSLAEKRKAKAEMELIKANEVMAFIDQTVAEFAEEGKEGAIAGDALLALMSRYGTNIKGAPLNIDHLTQALESVYQGDMSSMIEKMMTSKSRLAQEIFLPTIMRSDMWKKTEDSFIKAVHDINAGRKSDQPAEIIQVARQWVDTNERMRLDFNDAAGFEAIDKLEGWNFPQSWDAAKVKKLFPTEQAWYDFMVTRVDHSKMMAKELVDGQMVSTGKAMNEAQVREHLVKSYETIISNATNKIETGKPMGRGRATVFKHNQQRQLHIATPEAWIEINDMMGGGERIFDLMMGHTSRMASDTANLTVMPKSAFDIGLAHALALGEGNLGWKGLQQAQINNVYKNVSGTLEQGHIPLLGQAVRVARNVTVFSVLGNATVSAIADIPINMLTTWRTGAGVGGMGRVFGHHMHNTFGFGGSATASKALAMQRHLGAENWVQSAMGNTRFGEAAFNGWTGAIAQGLMRTSLLAPWTHGGRAAFKTELVGGWTNQRGTSWDGLQQEMRTIFESSNITPAMWDRFRNQKNLHHDMLPMDTKAAMPFNVLMQGAASKAVPTPDSRVNAIINQGQADTMPLGAATRMFGSLLTFPLTIMSNHHAEIVFSRLMKGPVDRVAYAAMLMGSMTAFGMASTMALDFFQGKEMRDLDSAEGVAKLARDGFWRGGSAGIIGGSFANLYEYGNQGPLSVRTPPSFSIANKLVNVTGAKAIYTDDYTWDDYKMDVVKAGAAVTPVPFYAAPLTTALTQHWKEIADPKAARRELRRKEREEKKELGRGYYNR